MPARRRTDPAAGRAALTSWAREPGTADRATTATAVRWALEELAERSPGNAVEVRVPPFGVTQCVPGPRHTRGTPPNVVETSADAWLRLVTGATGWDEALGSGEVRASGQRTDLSPWLPLHRVPLGTVEP